MAKIMTLVESLKEGYETAFGNLDERVGSLGDVRIKDVKDSVMPAELNLSQDGFYYLERVVIYELKNKSSDPMKGEPWKPESLDMDLWEFISNYADANNGAKFTAEEAYSHGKETIRDMIAMPYNWFVTNGLVRNFKGEGNSWESLREELNKYGIKLLKRGNVIKD